MTVKDGFDIGDRLRFESDDGTSAAAEVTAARTEHQTRHRLTVATRDEADVERLGAILSEDIVTVVDESGRGRYRVIETFSQEASTTEDAAGNLFGIELESFRPTPSG